MYLIYDGYISKPPKCRETLLGKEVADVVLDVGGTKIPCTCTGSNARTVGLLDVGTHIRVVGDEGKKVTITMLEVC